MKDQLLSPVLLRSRSCFYLSLDTAYNVTVSNEKFDNLLQLKKNFFDLFSKEDQEQWTTAFKKAAKDTANIASLTTCLNTGEEQLTIDWDISTKTNEANDISGFEILGVTRESKKIPTTHAEEEYKKILDSSSDIICVIDKNGSFKKVSAACRQVLGYEPDELIGRKYIEFVYNHDKTASKKTTVAIAKGHGVTNFENRFYKKDGTTIPLTWSSKWDKNSGAFYSVARDATEKKASEAALKASEEKYKLLFYDHPLPTWIYDDETLEFLEVNEAAIKHYGFTREEFLSMSLADILTENDFKKFKDLQTQKDIHLNLVDGLWHHKKKNGEVFFAEITSGVIHYLGRRAKIVLSFDRTQQTLAEQELVKSNEKYLFLSEATFEAIWDWNLLTNEIQWNDVAKKMFEIEDIAIISQMEWWLSKLHPEDKSRVQNKLNHHINERIQHWDDEYRFRTGSGNYKYIQDRGYLVFDESNKPVRMIGSMQDLTQRKAHEDMMQELNNSLEKRAIELAESNEELERFAYVASHDLQEPLRMVTSFLQLLEKRYKDKLDKKAHEYIAYAVDGAERMKKLILDLLEYSKVNTAAFQKEDVDLNEVLQELKLTYKNLLQETKGTIVNKKMPVVKANRTQITQLFQNLIGNAFKYKSDAPPQIQILVEEEKSLFKFAITDNGIGIDPKFFSKIFIIFQRLHNREQYSGTGIGLAICKKIIDKHGGKIWVTSTPGQGSTFNFTLPKS